MAFIEIKGLRKTFVNGKSSIDVLNGIDLAIEQGEIYGVVGLSGVGKSTLIRCLNRLETPNQGTITIGNVDILGLSENELRAKRRHMGMIFQSFNLLSSRTAAGNIAFPLEVAGVPKRRIKERVSELLELVGLSDKAASYPAQLSGGQKQRVGIARALANEPEVLLCDEATSALDPQTTTSILELIASVQKRLNLTVLLITHEMKVIVEICDRVAVMEGGKIVEEGPVIEVFTNPKSQVTRGFVEVILKRNSRFLENGYLPKGRLVRLCYIGDSITTPLVSTLVRLFEVDPIILQAHVDHIKDSPFGILLMDILGTPDNLDKALMWLRLQKDLVMEVLN
ncbi:MAG: ATP-binding cassette domain-containing protein [Deltaproteobacteria bacterium]|jgi:D-methionine transport system ATP-binding protein|nr:ATP-binding cassette domain-containing protein [Deltaproteobacteria bacterium]